MQKDHNHVGLPVAVVQDDFKIKYGLSYNKSMRNNKNRICNANKCNHTETWSMRRLSQWTQCLYWARDENPNENVSYLQYTWHVRGFFKLSSMRTFNNYPIISRHCQYLTSRETTLLKWYDWVCHQLCICEM